MGQRYPFGRLLSLARPPGLSAVGPPTCLPIDRRLGLRATRPRTATSPGRSGRHHPQWHPPRRYRRRTRGALRGSLDFPEDAWLIGVLGRFTPWKGQDLFLEIAAEWCARRARGHFVLIGHAFNEDQSFERRLREFVRERGLRERIQFVPFQRDVVSALSDLDLLLHTSRKPEPFGRVIIEAMAVGVPVIAARDGGVPEILTHGEDGLLAAPGHTAEYLAHIETLQSDATLRARLIGKARHTLESRFSLARVRADFDHLFDAVS